MQKVYVKKEEVMGNKISINVFLRITLIEVKY